MSTLHDAAFRPERVSYLPRYRGKRSFTQAAKGLGVSPSAVSHAMRALEENLGVRLLARTTRSVALTDAGERLVRRLGPAFAEVSETLDEISDRRDKPAGRVRLLLPRLAVTTVLAPKLGRLCREHPDIVLEVTTDNSRRDIVADGFDAGIHFGEYIEKDMIAVRVSPDHIPVIVAAPAYLAANPRPKAPRDLLKHRCINFSHGSAGLYRWEFEKARSPSLLPSLAPYRGRCGARCSSYTRRRRLRLSFGAGCHATTV